MKDSIKVYLKFHNYRYFPYEKKFAYKEIESLSGFEKYQTLHDGIEVTFNKIELNQLKKLVYFSHYALESDKLAKTFQSLLENGSNKNNSTKRQATRYGVHGLHEYKGKFNPQIVRCIINWFDVPKNSQIIDPFCGSGTTIIESIFAGFDSYGWDLNPFAVYLANAKLLALKEDPNTLKIQATRILSSKEKNDEKDKNNPRSSYLTNWFPVDTLAKIENYQSIIESESGQNAPFFKILLSDLLREYSLQEPSDLRIRRRKSPFPSISLEKAYKKAIERQLAELFRIHEVVGPLKFKGKAFEADGRYAEKVKSAARILIRADVAITSPPYATALPYIDTQRLSLVWLNLMQPNEIRYKEELLIGSRDAAGNTLRNLYENIQRNDEKLPESIQSLCLKLYNRINPLDGFRRQAVPGLLYRYFSDMQKTFNTVLKFVKPNGYYCLIVGTNRTTIGGITELINTPELLGVIAEKCGWERVETLNLETYKRYGIHAVNAVQGETLLVLRK